MLIGIHINDEEASRARGRLKADRDFGQLRRGIDRYFSLPNGFDLPPPGTTESKTFNLSVYEVAHMAAAFSAYHAVEPTVRVEQALTRFLRWTLDQQTLLWGAGFTQGQFCKGAILALDAVGESFSQPEREAILEHIVLASVENPDPSALVNNDPREFHPLRRYLEVPGVGFHLRDQECNNWNILAAMGLLYVARAADALFPRRATDVEAWSTVARRRLERFFELLYTDEGEYGEGPGYYSYATTGSVLTLDLLQRWERGAWWKELKTQGLMASPRWSREMHPREVIHGPFNVNDCALRRLESTLVAHWIARQSHDPETQSYGDELRALALDRLESVRLFGEHDLEPVIYSLLWRDDQLKAIPPQGRRTTCFGKFGTIVSRSGYSSEDVCLLFRCGATAGAHTQADRGTFLLTAYGENLVSEGGCPHDRTIPEFNTFHHATWAHNCALPAGQPQQRKDGDRFLQGKIRSFENTAEGFFARADCSEVYPGAGRVERSVRFSIRGWVLIHDQIETPGEAIEFLLHTDNRDRKTEFLIQPDRTLVCRPRATLFVIPLMEGAITDAGVHYQDSDPEGLRSLVIRRAASEMATLLVAVRAGTAGEVRVARQSPREWKLTIPGVSETISSWV